MKILYVTQYFPPESGAPQVRIPQLMRHMIQYGHEVTILTAMPNYPTGSIFPEYRGKLLMTEYFEEMRVIRTWMYPTTSVGFIRRTTSQISFSIASVLLGSWRAGRHDIMLIGSPPLFLAWTAWILKILFRCPYIMVVADLWPEVAIETKMLKNPWAIRLAKHLEKTFYRNAYAVTTQTPGQAANINNRYPNIKTHLVSGAVDTSVFSPELRSNEIRSEYNLDEKIGVLYLGSHGFAQGLDIILDVALLLRHREDIRIVMIGSGAVKQTLMARAEQHDLGNLDFYDPVPWSRVPAIMASMDIGVVPLRDGVPKATMPTKMYEMMASGLPIVVSANGESHDMVKDDGVGIAVPAGAANEFANAIQTLADDSPRRRKIRDLGVRLVRQRYDRTTAAHQLNALLSDIVDVTNR